MEKSVAKCEQCHTELGTQISDCEDCELVLCEECAEQHIQQKHFVTFRIPVLDDRLQCDDCGVINETVEETEVQEDDGEMVTKKLCDYCFRRYEQ